MLCVYDVIGSSIRAADARNVVKSISTALRPGGIVVTSVMNLELTRTLCRSGDNLFTDIHSKVDFPKLMRLPPSNSMQKTGEVFKGQLLLLNYKSGVTYRREQFIGESELPTEHHAKEVLGVFRKRTLIQRLCDLVKNDKPRADEVL